MISKLAKSIAHFFVVQNITEDSKEVIYAYGLELLISDMLNTLIVLLIALISHTLPAVIVFVAVFIGLRRFVGGYHANSHFSCMFTLIVVMLIFSYGICNVSGQIIWILSTGFVALSLPIIFCIAPVPHPNSGMKQICLLISSLVILSVSLLSGCGNSYTELDSSTNTYESNKSSNSDVPIVEATSVLAGYFHIMAGLFSWEKDTPNVIYGKINSDDDFGKTILDEYPQTIDMEYIIVFDDNGEIETVFCRQPKEGQESMASSGVVKHIEDIGVNTWEELLNYYNIK